MKHVFEAQALTRRFGETIALDGIDLAIPAGSVVGLIGRNGSGKSTLFGHVTGLLLPTSGTCRTLGVEGGKLGARELGRIGAVFQENRLLGWMTVEQHLRYVEAFHERWDREARILDLSPGNAQRVALVLAVCSRPSLLLLDEPLASIDPIAREKLLAFLLELVREDEVTVVIASHVLRDVESIVNRVLCLDRGRVVADADLDELLETYGQWEVIGKNGELPAHFSEPYILRQECAGYQARLWVRARAGELEAFAQRHAVEVRPHSVNLEAIFPLLIAEEAPL
jgi:ABC-2 type transport system ATP-binding protein